MPTQEHLQLVVNGVNNTESTFNAIQKDIVETKAMAEALDDTTYELDFEVDNSQLKNIGQQIGKQISENIELSADAMDLDMSDIDMGDTADKIAEQVGTVTTEQQARADASAVANKANVGVDDDDTKGGRRTLQDRIDVGKLPGVPNVVRKGKVNVEKLPGVPDVVVKGVDVDKLPGVGEAVRTGLDNQLPSGVPNDSLTEDGISLTLGDKVEFDADAFSQATDRQTEIDNLFKDAISGELGDITVAEFEEELRSLSGVGDQKPVREFAHEGSDAGQPLFDAPVPVDELIDSSDSDSVRSLLAKDDPVPVEELIDSSDASEVSVFADDRLHPTRNRGRAVSELLPVPVDGANVDPNPTQFNARDEKISDEFDLSKDPSKLRSRRDLGIGAFVGAALPNRDTKGLTEIDFSFKNIKSNFVDVSKTLKQTRVGLTEFYDIVAAGLPALLTFVGAVPLAAGGLIGLAGAAASAAVAVGGIVGLGALGGAINQAGGDMPSGEDFTAMFDGVGEEFVEAFREPAQQLAPLFEDGVDALGPLFDRLGRVSEQLLTLRPQVRELGSFIGNQLVGGTDEIISFAKASTGLFSLIGNFIENTNFSQILAGVLADSLPTLVSFSQAILNALPGLLSFSEGLAMVSRTTLKIIGGFTTVLGVLAALIPGLDNGTQVLGILVGTLLTATSAALLYGKAVALASFITGVKFIGIIAKSIAALFKLSGSLLLNAFTAGTFSTSMLLATASLVTFMAAALPVVGILGALVAGFSAVGDTVGGVGSDISDATDELRAFEQQKNSVQSGDGAFMGDLDSTVYVNIDNSTRVDGDVTDDNAEAVKGSQNLDAFTQYTG